MLKLAQYQTLKAAIAAETDTNFVALRNSGAVGAMAEWYNENSTFIVWKTALTEQDITSLVSSEGTTWDWALFMSRQQGERDGWNRMFNGTYTINPSLPQVRAGINAIFSGSGAGQISHLLAMGKRPARRGEALFATGTGTTATPGLLTFEGILSGNDIITAINLA